MAHPPLSVVIVAITGLPALHECLTALVEQSGEIGAELIVVAHRRDDAARYLQGRFPQVKVIEVAERRGIPAMRALGIAQATGEFVVVTEARCVATENWLAEILAAHASGYEVVGGAIEPQKIHRLLDWAVYLCEYSYSMLPIPAGEVTGLPGNNSSYRRVLLAELDEPLKSNYWESFWQEALRQRGAKLLSVPEILLYKQINFSFSYFLAQRFHFSRSFAGMRRARVSPVRRLFYLATVPLLPPLMLLRMGQQVWRKGRFRREFALALPLLAIFMVSYAAGELTGYLLGGGDSLLKVE